MQDVAIPVSLQSSKSIHDIPFLLGSNTSFFTPPIQLIFSILFQHHVSKLSVIPDLLSKVPKFQHHK